MTIPIINSHNSWSPLQEVWLGDVYPAHWYDHLPAETRDAFYHLTQITQEDLVKIQRTIESFGVTVRRPVYENLDQFIQESGQLVKPQICPRDQFVTLGNTLVAHQWHTAAWQPVLDEYAQHTDCTVVLTDNPHLNGANVVRRGRDLIIDTPCPEAMCNDFLQDFRVQLINNGGHVDGCLATLKPGLLMANQYYPLYEETFPGWTKIVLDLPEFHTHIKYNKPDHNGKWWLPSLNNNRSFNEHVLKHATDWVGNYTETYFDVNCLVIDEANVIMLGYNPALEKTLSQHGITVHWVSFRTRTFWDGGLHCLTVDIRRSSTM